MSSRLFQHVRERHGFVYSIYSSADFFVDTGIFCIYAGADNARVDDVNDLVAQELGALAQNSITQDELKSAKTQIRGGVTISLESMSARMSRLARIELYNEPYRTVDEMLELINNVTADEIQQVVADIFNQDKICTTLLRPTTKPAQPKANAVLKKDAST